LGVRLYAGITAVAAGWVALPSGALAPALLAASRVVRSNVAGCCYRTTRGAAQAAAALSGGTVHGRCGSCHVDPIMKFQQRSSKIRRNEYQKRPRGRRTRA
jgi:cytochrome c5